MGEFGRYRGRALAALLEELPLRVLYRRATFLTISESARDDLVQIDGLGRERVSVAYCGVEPGLFGLAQRDEKPRLVHLGRLKAYKRIEHVLDVLEAIPGAALDIVGEGDHREALEADIARRGLTDRVTMHGHVDEETRAALYARAWILLTASSSEGWGLTVIEAALCGTPSAALAVGGLRESIVDGQTGILARDISELTARVRDLIADRDRPEELGRRPPPGAHLHSGSAPPPTTCACSAPTRVLLTPPPATSAAACWPARTSARARAPRTPRARRWSPPSRRSAWPAPASDARAGGSSALPSSSRTCSPSSPLAAS